MKLKKRFWRMIYKNITVGCYYLDYITLLDEDSYFEKIKTDINNVDENKIISNIITVGI